MTLRGDGFGLGWPKVFHRYLELHDWSLSLSINTTFWFSMGFNIGGIGLFYLYVWTCLNIAWTINYSLVLLLLPRGRHQRFGTKLVSSFIACSACLPVYIWQVFSGCTGWLNQLGSRGNLQQPSINGGFNGKITYERRFIVAKIIKLFFSIFFNHYILAAIIFAITRRRLFRKIMSSVSKEQTSANFNQKHGVIPYKRTASNPFSYCNMPLRSRLRRARQILEGE